MPGAVDEVVAEACVFNDRTRGPIDLPSRDWACGCDGVDDEPGSGLAGVAHDAEDLLLALAGLGDDAGPGDVVVDRFRSVQLGPDIDEDKVAGLEVAGEILGGLIVRIAAVGAGGDNGQTVGDQMLALQCLGQPLTDAPLVPAAVAHAM